jgi:hypothetical protein
MVRASTCVAILVALAGCRLRFDDVAVTDGSIDAPVDVAPDQLRVQVTGHGAVTGAAPIGCGHDCTYTIAAPVTVTAIAGDSWRFDHYDPPCGVAAVCTVPAGTTVHATFVRTPITANRVFVTSETAAIGGSGRAGLDAQCQARATAGQLVGTFIAGVSTSAQDARDRLTGSRGWVRLDGLPFLDQPTQLGSPDVVRGVVYDELLGLHGAFVLTGSTATGTLVAGNACTDWTSGAGPASGGLSDGAGLYAVGSSNFSCANPIYCFETGHNVAVTLKPAPFPIGRYVFLTAWNVAGGIAAGDAKCQTEATNVGLAGSYKALVATTAQSAADHLGGVAGVWRRPDGIVVAYDGLDQASWDAHVGTNASGGVLEGFPSLGAPNLTSVATLAQSCNDWTTAAGTQYTLSSYRTLPLSGVGQAQCTGNNIVTCAQTQ